MDDALSWTDWLATVAAATGGLTAMALALRALVRWLPMKRNGSRP